MADSAIVALNSVLRGASVEDHEEALSLANAAAKVAKPGTAEYLTAHHTKVVALLKLDRFDDALRAMAAGGAKLEEECLLEKSYALYKTGDLAEAEKLISNISTPSRGLKHVAAQVAYRGEKFGRAAAIYEKLVETSDSGHYGEDNDLRINSSATNAQLQWQGNSHLVPEDQKQPRREELEAFETAFNAACGCLARGDFAKAAILLKRSRDLCEASEDLSDEEKKLELIPIIVQQAYVCTKLDKLDEAAKLQQSFVLTE
jgi:signal recognition particle subunit SRP72